ncbi:hypothetical protein SBP1_gp070 [Vibrio virus vB_VspP_SBP1]|uniref:Uncharacterized protein n=1 Tax=Vibrio virus vB_VspP_SBP1 TaxID=2500581 RepID=A0A3T0IIL7_9CAUD|nr:hypothetical protein KNU36_gp059 [Vibrio virus vB_VspP_SBP1]AZU99662.1 hypothetical protein SBP1_gp070 [Vibrio virus vB_VspP_SBP1]
MKNELSVEMLQSIAPKSVQKLIDQQYVDDVNALINDPDTASFVRDTLISSSDVIKQGRYTFEQYINACKYATFKSMGETNISSFIKTFPDKYQDWLAQGKSDKEISRYVSAFANSKCVEEVIKKVSISFYVQNMDIRQKALNVQAEIMMTATSEKVRSDAANSVLTHTKPPEEENAKLQVDINVNENSSHVGELRETMRKMAELQQQIIAGGGMTAQQVAHTPIIEGEIEDVDDE